MISEEELIDLEKFYKDSDIEWWQKGEESEEDVIKLIEYIRHLLQNSKK